MVTFAVSAPDGCAAEVAGADVTGAAVLAGAVVAAGVAVVGDRVAGTLAGAELASATALLACTVGVAADAEQPVSATAARAARAADGVAMFMSRSLPGADVAAIGATWDRAANKFPRRSRELADNSDHA
jgi:hypothetical protein